MLMLLSVTFCSCAGLLQSPEMYEDEIEDAVKFNIAEMDFIVEYIQKYIDDEYDYYIFDDRTDKFEDAILERYNNNDMSYEEALKSMAGGSDYYANYAKRILALYRQTNISLSDYEVSSSRSDYKSWTFKELHSGVTFLFEIYDIQSDTPKYSITPIEESIDKYIKKHM